MISSEIPGWIRIAQIIIGAVAIGLSIVVLIFPGLTTLTLVYLLSLILIITGIEKVSSSLTYTRKSRYIDLGLGILVIAIGIAALVFPLVAALIFISLIAFGLMFDGISRVMEGIYERNRHKWNRAFNIGTGALSIILAGVVLIMPIIGEILISFIIGVALLVTGILILTSGITGRKDRGISI